MIDRASPTTQAATPRTLIFSLRNIFPNDLYRCPLYEFENVVQQIDNADIISPYGYPTSRRNALALRLASHGPITLKAKIQQLQVDRHYDVFFAICGWPRDLLMIHAVRHLRDVCTIKICLLDEAWVKQMGYYRHFLDVLKDFDIVALYYSGSVTALSKRIRRPCIFVPPGIDAVRFCPYPLDAPRVVDVLSVGRKSPATHEALLKMVQDDDIFYVHDSIAGTEAIDSTEHRMLYANIAKRSKYSLVNPGLIDRPDRRGDQIEIGNRYFEGMAAGTIMVGEIPENDHFEHLFDWPDAVVHLPYGSANIAGVIAELERDPVRQQRIRRSNVVHALTRHDWLFRWETILQSSGLTPMPQLFQRKQNLTRLAEIVSGQTCAFKTE